jgi:hypothetical protein
VAFCAGSSRSNGFLPAYLKIAKGVYTTVLGKEEAAKVNRSADDALLKYSILPKVWTNNFLHPALSSDE